MSVSHQIDYFLIFLIYRLKFFLMWQPTKVSPHPIAKLNPKDSHLKCVLPKHKSLGYTYNQHFENS